MTRTVSVTLTDNATPVMNATVTLADASNTYGIRDAITNATVVAAGTSMPHVGNGVYSYAFTSAVAGVAYESTVRIAWADGSIDYVDRPLAGDADDVTGGRYWTLAGIYTLMGKTNAAVESNLDNGQTGLVLDQVIADGATADAYTDFRATRGTMTAATPILSTAPNFAMVQLATNLYASWLLISHRIDWDVSPSEMGDPKQAGLVDKAKGLYSRAMELYGQIFGPIVDTSVGGFTSVPLIRDSPRPYRCY